MVLIWYLARKTRSTLFVLCTNSAAFVLVGCLPIIVFIVDVVRVSLIYSPFSLRNLFLGTNRSDHSLSLSRVGQVVGSRMYF